MCVCVRACEGGERQEGAEQTRRGKTQEEEEEEKEGEERERESETADKRKIVTVFLPPAGNEFVKEKSE